MEMCASYLSLSGSSHGEYPRYNPLERAKAAHSAGIPSIGVLWNEEITPGILHYAEIYEVEWFELSRVITPDMDAAMRKLASYGAKLVKTGLCDAQFPVEWAAGNLRQLVQVAARYGLTVAVEPVAWGHTPSLHDTLSMMRQAGVLDHPSVGICYDLWQIAYGTPLGVMMKGDLPRIAKMEISGIQLPWENRDIPALAMNRPPLGDSEIDIPQQAKRVLAQQDVPVTYEVPNQSLREMPLTDAAMTIARDMDLL